MTTVKVIPMPGPIGTTPNLYCGYFYDTTNQASAGVTSANLVTVNSTSISNGISIINNSQITFANAGRYLINFLSQFTFTGGASNYNITVWWTKNGQAIANSAYTFTNTGAQNSQVLANVENIIQVNSGDYIQFYWWSGAAGMSLLYTAAGTTPTRPASPSVNISVFNVG